jgi:hypothetical protein
MNNTGSSIENNNEQSINNIIKTIHIILFVFFNIIIINGVKKMKTLKFQQNKYRKNVFLFITTLFQEMLFIPILLFIYWFIYIFLFKLLIWFLKYITYSGESVQKNPNENKGSIQDIIKIILSKIINNILIDIKIYFYLFIINIVILIALALLLLPVALSNKNGKKTIINDNFIERLFTIYQVLLVISIILIFNKYTYN